jgi:hypothetical protein
MSISDSFGNSMHRGAAPAFQHRFVNLIQVSVLGPGEPNARVIAIVFGGLRRLA